jgi:2-polyprenyl-3-methyl-5-hydroxy-6-metoxy-1,4-benzoquinol methylase
LLVQRHPVPDDRELALIYQDTSAASMDYAVEDNLAWRLAREFLSARFATRELHVLDVGCHTGRFLAALPGEWQRYGIESAKQPCEIAKNQGIRIIAERLQTVDPAWHGRFDVLTAFDVLEHLPDPGLALSTAHQLLKPGGLFVLSSGDADRWPFRALDGAHWYWQTAQHISAISESFLRRAAPRGGFELQQLRAIAHRRAPFWQRCREALALSYWFCRLRGGLWRLPQRILHSIPTLTALRHSEAPPWTMTLRDHCWVVLAKETA